MIEYSINFVIKYNGLNFLLTMKLTARAPSIILLSSLITFIFFTILSQLYLAL